MKLNNLIAQLQKISDQRGNPEICLPNSMDPKRNDIPVEVIDRGFILGVDDEFSRHEPVSLYLNGAGLTRPNPAGLKDKRQYERLLIVFRKG